MLVYLRDGSAQSYMLPHWDWSCRPNFPSHPVTVYWHWANQSQHWPSKTRRLARKPLECQFLSMAGMTLPRKNPGASGIRTPDLPLSRRTPEPLGQRGGKEEEEEEEAVKKKMKKSTIKVFTPGDKGVPNIDPPATCWPPTHPRPQLPFCGFFLLGERSFRLAMLFSRSFLSWKVMKFHISQACIKHTAARQLILQQ